MASSLPVVLRLVAASVNISHRAGRIIRDVMNKGELGIVSKGKNDLQTEADRSGQKCIVASLYRQFPKISIFGEEDEDPKEKVREDWIEESQSEDVLAQAEKFPENLKNVTDEEVVVWVDPLDGTSEYTEGLLDHVTVLIGICVRGEAVGGVIYQPYYNYQAGPDAQLGRVIWGIVGLGAFGFTPTVAPAGQNIITTTRSHSNNVVNDAVQAAEPSEVLRAGGCGHKVLLILEGKAHAYVFASPGCKKWDTAAPEAVLHACGGKLTDMHGSALQYHGTVQRKNAGGVLAVSQAEKHQWYLDRVPQHVKDALPPVLS